jgi:hypothetical protein
MFPYAINNGLVFFTWGGADFQWRGHGKSDRLDGQGMQKRDSFW